MRSQIAPTKSKTNRSNAQVKINDVNSVVELLWLLSMGIGLCYGEGRNLSTKRNHVISRVEREVTRSTSNKVVVAVMLKWGCLYQVYVEGLNEVLS